MLKHLKFTISVLSVNLKNRSRMDLNAKKKHGSWASKLGFLFASVGAAVGLGNIQRFPHLTAENGGAAFVCIYIVCMFLVGIPSMLMEFALGRNTQEGPVAAIKQITPKSSWYLLGILLLINGFFVLTYYSCIAGWSLGYVFKPFFPDQISLELFQSNGIYSVGLTVGFLVLVYLVVKQGLQQGVEVWSKRLVPVLVLCLLFLAVVCMTLPGANEGVKYYLYPDWSKVSVTTWVEGLGQAFFSLCVGEAVLITFGSYVEKDVSLVSSAVKIAIMDTIVALLAGLVIFPAVFSFGGAPDQYGVGLVFTIMPKLFEQWTLGTLVGFVFFVSLFIAALTTGIALFEICVGFLLDHTNMNRGRACNTVVVFTLAFAVPSSLSHGSSEFLSSLQLNFGHRTIQGFYELMDFFWGNVGMLLGGALLCIYCGWVWGAKNCAAEIAEGSGISASVLHSFTVYIRYVLPLLVIPLVVYLIL